MDGEETGEGLAFVEDEEVIAVGAFDFFDDLDEGIIDMEVVEISIEIFLGAIGLFDFEGIEGFGVNDAFDLALTIDNREIGKTGFVEFVENEGTKDFFAFDEDHLVLGDHKI